MPQQSFDYQKEYVYANDAYMQKAYNYEHMSVVE